MGKNKNKKTNATTKSKKGDGPAREKNRQERIWVSKRKEEEDETILKEAEEKRLKKEAEEARLKKEEEEARLKDEEEARLNDEEEARLIEKQKNKSQFGGLTYLVIEFPKGGQLNKFRKFHYIPPCTVKGIYVKQDAPNSEKSINGLVEMMNIYRGRRNDVRFLPFSRYNRKLLKFLKRFMPNMLAEPFFYVIGNPNTKRNIEWYIAYYWRLEWLKHGFPHLIDELDFYWKIFDLYSKFPMHKFLLDWWGNEAGYYKVEFPSELTESIEPTEPTDQIMVMVCHVYDISNEISHITKKSPAILSDSSGSEGLRQIFIAFDVDEEFANVVPGRGLVLCSNLELYV